MKKLNEDKLINACINNKIKLKEAFKKIIIIYIISNITVIINKKQMKIKWIKFENKNNYLFFGFFISIIMDGKLYELFVFNVIIF